MMKRLVPFAFAGILGLVAVALMQQYLDRQRHVIAQERARLQSEFQEPLEVIVARADLEEGTTVTTDHLSLRPIPKKFVQPFATSRASDLVGRVTLAPIAEGEQFLKNKVREPHEVAKGETLSKLTPKGYRAITLGMDELRGVGGFVRPGDTVDILWTFQAPPPGGGEPRLPMARAAAPRPASSHPWPPTRALCVPSRCVGPPPKRRRSALPAPGAPQPVSGSRGRTPSARG